MKTALQSRPAAPVCLVMSLWPIIWSARMEASRGLPLLDLGRGVLGAVGSIRVDDPDTALEAVVEGALSTAASKDLGLDNGIVTAWAH
jgi:hypothetical protein